MRSFIKLGLINSETSPILKPTAPPVSWVTTQGTEEQLLLCAPSLCLCSSSLALHCAYPLSCSSLLLLSAPPQRSSTLLFLSAPLLCSSMLILCPLLLCPSIKPDELSPLCSSSINPDAFSPLCRKLSSVHRWDCPRPSPMTPLKMLYTNSLEKTTLGWTHCDGE